MYTSSSNHSSQFGNFFYVGNCGSGEEEQKRPLQTYFFFFFFFLLCKNHTIHDVDNVESSHLIKLVHAVQSLRGKKNCTYVMP